MCSKFQLRYRQCFVVVSFYLRPTLIFRVKCLCISRGGATSELSVMRRKFKMEAGLLQNQGNLTNQMKCVCQMYACP